MSVDAIPPETPANKCSYFTLENDDVHEEPFNSRRYVSDTLETLSLDKDILQVCCCVRPVNVAEYS